MKIKSIKRSNLLLLIGFGLTVLLIAAFLITGRIILDKYIGPPDINRTSHISQAVHTSALQ